MSSYSFDFVCVCLGVIWLARQDSPPVNLSWNKDDVVHSVGLFFTFSNDFGRKEEIDNDGLLFSLSSCQIQLKDISRVGFIFDYNYITFLLLAILILSTQKSKEREHAQAV